MHGGLFYDSVRKHVYGARVMAAMGGLLPVLKESALRSAAGMRFKFGAVTSSPSRSQEHEAPRSHLPPRVGLTKGQP
jgi:hypothetical protein